jgi:lipopolysaccharide assembly outer membrane protein LptD (OstA)
LLIILLAGFSCALAQSDDIEGPVKYEAEWIDINTNARTMYLRGDARVSYQQFTLEAGVIFFDWPNDLIYAWPDTAFDSLGVEYLLDFPVFIENSKDTLRANNIVYNFVTREGKLNEGKTKESNNYYSGSRIRKLTQKSLLIRAGRFTTCDQDTPDYYFAADEMKMTINENIVARNVYLHIADIPLLYIPFGVFPNKKGRNSGFTMPTFEQSETRGRTLRNLGYYFGVSDYWDALLSADFFEKRGLLYRGKLRYKKRYNFHGDLRAEYSPRDLSSGEKRDRWSLKVNHYQTISPDQNFSVSGSFFSDRQYGSDLYANIEDRVRQKINSSARYQIRWPESRNSLNVNANSWQDLTNGEYNIKLPDVSFSHSSRQLFPFAGGSKKWYHSINYSYNSRLLNEINHDLVVDTDTLQVYEDTERRGIEHRASISASQKIFKYFSLSPSINYNEIWVDRTQAWNATSQELEEVETLAARRTFSTSLSARTTVYGVFPAQIGALRSIRHKMDPTIALNYRPDFSDRFWGYYETYEDTLGVQEFDRFAGGAFGNTSAGETKSLSFSLANLFQAKYIDGGEEKRIDLFRVTASTNYNFAATTKKLGNLQTSLSATPNNNFSVQMSATFTPYEYDDDGIGFKDTYLGWENGLYQLSNVSVNSRFAITGKELAEKSKSPEDSLLQEEDEFNEQFPGNTRKRIEDPTRQLKQQQFNWQLSSNFSFSLDRNNRSNPTKRLVWVPAVSLSLTENWRLRWNSSLDLLKGTINYQHYSLYRDLHCWEMSLNWSPSGTAGYFQFRINVKASALQDLKYEFGSSGNPVF